MDSMGTVTVSDKAVMQIASHIAGKCDGVVKLTDKSSRKGLSRALKRNGEPKGVYVVKSKYGLELEICVVCRYGVNTLDIRDEICEKIKSQLEWAGFKINTINVIIIGVQK